MVALGANPAWFISLRLSLAGSYEGVPLGGQVVEKWIVIPRAQGLRKARRWSRMAAKNLNLWPAGAASNRAPSAPPATANRTKPESKRNGGRSQPARPSGGRSHAFINAMVGASTPIVVHCWSLLIHKVLPEIVKESPLVEPESHRKRVMPVEAAAVHPPRHAGHQADGHACPDGDPCRTFVTNVKNHHPGRGT